MPVLLAFTGLQLLGASLLVLGITDDGTPVRENWRVFVGVGLFFCGDAIMAWFLLRNRMRWQAYDAGQRRDSGQEE